jgi:pilus assembly protein CpaC
MFRPFGVKVDFTPIVTPDGAIRLKVNPEVSTLDFSNAVTISGFTVPALSTRRAETEVELRNGQSFVVSGILDHRTTQNLSSIPGIASIPILGQLFRSKQLQRSVVELVVIVTATVVDPLSSREPAVEPKMAVPNMQRGAFDAQLSGSKKNAITTSPQH